MSGLIGLLSTDELALCFYGRRRCKRDVRWLSGTFQRMHQSFESDGDSGFEWIVGYALCLFQQLDNKRNEVALACLCIASKMLDDRCAEIGDGVWEAHGATGWSCFALWPASRPGIRAAALPGVSTG